MNTRQTLNTLLVGLLVVIASCGQKNEAKKGAEQPAVASFYAEQHRPQLHFSPKEKWMNDPNGMVYHKETYHLFYQYFPDSTVWGPMHWGHATSKDLVHWENQPIAIYPDTLGWIFSGSAVVDKENTSGLGTKENPPLVAIFTYHSDAKARAGRNDVESQGLAYSTDDGVTWKKYEHNPVLKNPGIRDFRDPKVSWHDASKQWIMTLAVQDHIEFYSSPDLITWSKRSEFGKGKMGSHGGVWECPDLFEIAEEGSKEKQWVLLVSINPGGPNAGSATQYFVGSFDGKKFEQRFNVGDTTWVDYGPDNYAGVTWSNAPDHRKIFMGWMNNWHYGDRVPTERWRGATTIPRELSLVKNGEKRYLVSRPVPELKALATEAIPQDSSNKALSVIEGEFDAATSEKIELSNAKGELLTIGWDKGQNKFYIDRSQAGDASFATNFIGDLSCPRFAKGPKIPFTIVTDVASVEVFFDNGLSVMTATFFPQQPLSAVKYAGGTRDTSPKVTYLTRIWQ